jgi:hypothetical protein
MRVAFYPSRPGIFGEVASFMVVEAPTLSCISAAAGNQIVQIGKL